MIMRAQALLDRNPHPSERELRDHMEPNLCRCGTHMRILAAVRDVAGMPQPVAQSIAQPQTEAKAQR
jgi:aerobic-type carbon monoxide dehydrogenase small subunit (CoxS/CutS family)